MFVKSFILFLQRLLTLNRMEKEKVNRYVVNMLAVVNLIINKGATAKIEAYLYPKGAIIRINLRVGGVNEVSIEEKETLKEAGDAVGLDRFLKGFEYVTFGGTNVINNDNEIIFIKEDKWSEWLESSAKKDMKFLLKEGGKK